MTKKMTKQVRTMVEAANDVFKARHLKDERDEMFTTVCYLLIEASCYWGYNYYTKDGFLSGGNTESFDHLEILVV